MKKFIINQYFRDAKNLVCEGDDVMSIYVNAERFPVTIKDRLFMLFGRKICPKCGTSLYREKLRCVMSAKDYSIKYPSKHEYIGKVYCNYYKFTCPTCSYERIIGDNSGRL